MESKGEAIREIQTNFAEVVDVVDRFFELTESKGEASQENQTSNEFITSFHQSVSRIFFQELFSVWAVEKENLLILLVQNSFFFFSVCQLIKKS